jgi:hypothetical protein
VVNKLTVKRIATMGEIRSRIFMAHKVKPIQKLAFEGSDFYDEDPYEEWMLRSNSKDIRQITAKVAPLVQVNIEYMGERRQMNVRIGTPRNEFQNQVKTFLVSSHNLEAILLGGYTDWEIKEGHT